MKMVLLLLLSFFLLVVSIGLLLLPVLLPLITEGRITPQYLVDEQHPLESFLRLSLAPEKRDYDLRWLSPSSLVDFKLHIRIGYWFRRTGIES